MNYHSPPFTSSDPLKTYHIILRGFDSIGFEEKTFSKQCVNLIRSLCRENPTERLGIRGRNGYGDIKKHKWFANFNWNHLLGRKLVPPIVPQLTSDIDTRYFDTIPVQPDGKAINVGMGNQLNDSLRSSILRKCSCQPSNSSANTSSSSSSDGSKGNKMNHESSRESNPLNDFIFDWESYF